MNPWLVIGWILLVLLLLAIAFWLIVCGLAALAYTGVFIPLGIIHLWKRIR